MKCEACEAKLSDEITKLEQFKFDFVFKSYEDGVKNNTIIDTKTQLFVAYIGVTLVPLHDYYDKHPSVFDSFFSLFGATLLFFVLSLFFFFKVIREPFEKFNYLGSKTEYSYFFPKKYEDDKPIEHILQSYKASFKKANYETLLDNLILERLKFQHVYYQKVAFFRRGALFTSIYTAGLIIIFFK